MISSTSCWCASAPCVEGFKYQEQFIWKAPGTTLESIQSMRVANCLYAVTNSGGKLGVLSSVTTYLPYLDSCMIDSPSELSGYGYCSMFLLRPHPLAPSPLTERGI